MSCPFYHAVIWKIPCAACRPRPFGGFCAMAWCPSPGSRIMCTTPSAARREPLTPGVMACRLLPAWPRLDFHHGVRRVWGRKILAKATHGLATTRPQFSARKRVTLAQGAAFLILAALPCAEFRLFAGQRPLGCGQRRPWLVFSLGYCLAPVLPVFASSRESCKAWEIQMMRTCRLIPFSCRCSGKPRCSASFCADCPA